MAKKKKGKIMNEYAYKDAFGDTVKVKHEIYTREQVVAEIGEEAVEEMERFHLLGVEPKFVHTIPLWKRIIKALFHN